MLGRGRLDKSADQMYDVKDVPAANTRRAGHESGGRVMVENHGRERVVTPAGRADRQTLITIDFMTVPYGQASRYALDGMHLEGKSLHTSLSGRPEFGLPSYPPVRNKLRGPAHPALHACALLHVIAILAVMTFRCSRCSQSYQ
ncbi:uncharacterized protein BO87DRAFT_401753 [Aspergillus neoniger CBS 115656]|uniref:Uncharacterized protein n=1 Tax=Aspergillus neoniger (strain CBS 115656) TaxID=1448310 RepID=A0A318Y3T0_ASPNB|nr:hypothetical protein BO87DRAFT_401753 [Aspergillus neoniger CBS 115656]PYH28955.1 hypothetical protein BO87DRAFT_401753 [Aspergillus neoniger CBS 115656]